MVSDESSKQQPAGEPSAPAAADAPPGPGQSAVDDYNRVQMGRPDRRHSLALLLICIGIYVPQMGAYGMFDPWETHYTEVARQFMVRGNWMETYWHNGTGPEGWAETNFWSKPVGSFWLSGLSLKLFGYGAHTTGQQIATGKIEWAVRLPFFLCALFGIYFIYLMCARLFNRRTGVLAGVILASAPMYFMIGRQAMTDMPYVGLMTGGLALFVLAMFGEREQLPRKEARIGRWTLSWPHAPAYYVFLAAFTLVVTLQLTAIIDALRRVPLPVKILGAQMSAAIVMVIWVAAALLAIWLTRKTRTRNEVYLYGFYMAVAYAGLAKGLIGALQPGMVILVYLLASREWRLLTDVAMARGLLIACCVFWPWWHGMVLRFGKPFWHELMGTEQMRRLTVGEQAQAKGTFEYYVQQLGYGLFPWIAFLPVALVRALGIGRQPERRAVDRARMFVYVWFLAAMVLFTLTVTKYHHYILAAIPPAAVIIAIWLDDLLAGKVRAVPATLLISAGVLLLVAIDLVEQPAHWVWMFTYLYTSNWARGVPEGPQILIYAIAFGVPLLLLFFRRLRAAAVWLAVAVAVVVGGYVLNWYIVGCGPHWSQKRVIQTYYKDRRSPEDKLIAWQFNWRGETWYTGAEVVVSKSLNNDKIVAWLKERPNRRFYFITERSRYAGLRNMLPTAKGKKTLRIVNDSNVHYVLAAADL